MNVVVKVRRLPHGEDLHLLGYAKAGPRRATSVKEPVGRDDDN
jgi:hypothetical protein